MKARNKDDAAQVFTLRNSSGKDIRFKGWKLAEVGNYNPDVINANGDCPSTGSRRWKERAVYQTEGGKIVCHKLGRSRVTGEVDRGEVRVVGTDADLTKRAGLAVTERTMFAKANATSPERVAEIDGELRAEFEALASQPLKAPPADEQVKAFFGNDPLAKTLLADLGIEDVQDIA